MKERERERKNPSARVFERKARLVAAEVSEIDSCSFPERERAPAPHRSPRALPSLEPTEQALLAPRGNEAPPHAAHQAPLLPRRRRRSRTRRRSASDGFFFFLVFFFFSSFDAHRGIVGVGECRSSPQPVPPPGLGLARGRPAVAGQVVRARRCLVRGAEAERKREQEGLKFGQPATATKTRTSFEKPRSAEAPVLSLVAQPFFPSPQTRLSYTHSKPT